MKSDESITVNSSVTNMDVIICVETQIGDLVPAYVTENVISPEILFEPQDIEELPLHHEIEFGDGVSEVLDNFKLSCEKPSQNTTKEDECGPTVLPINREAFYLYMEQFSTDLATALDEKLSTMLT